MKSKLPSIPSDYWASYGGVRALVRSKYLGLAIVLLLPTYGLWSAPGWWDLPLQVLPNIVSFSLAGFAMFMAFGDDRFKRLMVDVGEEKGPFLPISATFTHFIVVQTIAIILAVVAKAQVLTSTQAVFPHVAHLLPVTSAYRVALRQLFWAFSFGTFLYAITSILAATFAVFRVSRWFNEFHSGHSADQTDDTLSR